MLTHYAPQLSISVASSPATLLSFDRNLQLVVKFLIAAAITGILVSPVPLYLLGIFLGVGSSVWYMTFTTSAVEKKSALAQIRVNAGMTPEGELIKGSLTGAVTMQRLRFTHQLNLGRVIMLWADTIGHNTRCLYWVLRPIVPPDDWRRLNVRIRLIWQSRQIADTTREAGIQPLRC